MKIVIKCDDIEISYEEPQGIEKYPMLVNNSNSNAYIVDTIKKLCEEVIKIKTAK